jgi:hypothetical protein
MPCLYRFLPQAVQPTLVQPTLRRDDPWQLRIRSWLACHAEAVAFWAIVLAYLLPVWVFRYVPTQDGPSHVFNAQVIKDYRDPAAGYAEVFAIRPDPLPNWTSHLLLAALLHLVPPLTAEKVLVSLYVVGFAGALRYFLGAFGERCRPLSWAGLLFIYNRCFWLGFYNYCLGLVLLWAILGYALRRREALHITQAVVLMILLTAAYFTHLFSFLLAWAGALLAVLRIPPWRSPGLVLTFLAGLPAACLTLDYFERTGFFQEGAPERIVGHPLPAWRGTAPGAALRRDIAALDRELFECHAGAHPPFSVFLLPYYALLVCCTVAESLRRREQENVPRPRWFLPLLAGLLLFAAYLLVPDSLDRHGSVIKARLALLPPIVWLACLREPARLGLRIVSRAAVFTLLGANLLLVTGRFAAGNQALAQYMAGMEAVGRGGRLFVVQPDPQPIPLADPLFHASNYYCLGTGIVNLNNYETDAPHFPVQFRPGFRRGRGNWETYPNQDAVDVVLCWQTSPQLVVKGPADWDEVFNQGPLRIYRRGGGK